MRRAADGQRTLEAVASYKEKHELEEKVKLNADLIDNLQKGVILKEEKLKEMQV